MSKHFPAKIVAFAVTEHSRGFGWPDIQDSIRQTFQIEPPSPRVMRDWFAEYGGETLSMEKVFREASIRAVRDSWVVAGLAIQQLALQEDVPVLLRALRQGKDPTLPVVVFILSTLEKMVGSELYKKGARRIQQRRKGLVAGWVNTKTKRRS